MFQKEGGKAKVYVRELNLFIECLKERKKIGK